MKTMIRRNKIMQTNLSENQKFEEVTIRFWKPLQIGDRIVGKVIGTEPFKDKQVVRLQTLDGSYYIGQTVAVNKIKSLIGDTVRIVYQGEKRSANGRPYKNFTVERAVLNVQSEGFQ
jgi:hypothetical protein